MQPELPDVLNVLFMTRADHAVLDRVRAIAPGRLNVMRAPDEFQAALRRQDRVAQRVADDAQPQATELPEDVAQMVRKAHVMFMSIPYPRGILSQAEDLLWGHFSFAGVSNLMGTDWWQPDVTVTSTRGLNNALPIAETVIAAIYMFARRLDKWVEQTLAHQYESRAIQGAKLVTGKTLGIVGLGGIGSHAARIARGCGMRVVATRRSAEARLENVDGVDVLYPASRQNEMLAECDFVAVCAMLTPETTGMVDRAAIEAMKPGAYLINIARGEIIDEAALADALQSGHLAGALLDVWEDDMNGTPPNPALQSAPNLILTPHTSNRTDVPQGFAVDVFCRNLDHLLKGEPLENVVDWARGY